MVSIGVLIALKRMITLQRRRKGVRSNEDKDQDISELIVFVGKAVFVVLKVVEEVSIIMHILDTKVVTRIMRMCGIELIP